MAYEVSIIRCGTYDDDRLRAAVEASLKPLGGLSSVVKKGDRVLIKLNLLNAKRPEQAVTTHPAVAKAIVRMVQDTGGVPVLGDSPGGSSTGTSYKNLLKTTGIQAVADETGCEIASFDEAAEVTPERARTYKKLKIARAVTDADVVIGLPKLKTHSLTYYTGAVKLLYGYIPGVTKTEYHLHTGRDVSLFAEMLLDIYEARPPDLYVMDAVVGMEGNGPSGGTPRDIGLIMASRSATAMDFVATAVVGMDPLAVPTVKRAFERGTGPGSLDDIMVHGESVAAVLVKDFKKARTMSMSRVPPALMGVMTRLGGSRPQIDKSKCVKCGVCAKDCPPKAIAFVKGSVPKIDYGKCIRCYCCQELCPQNAVSVRTPLLRRLIK
ncbi:MAG: F(420)H(2) dehydrogenase subunit I [Methanocella sp. PtaU1.Bin125]|nr:MAG: F(420)H(2) dehydrogenase subunit I [Methanocella sp. PtaU1.Bin125]